MPITGTKQWLAPDTLALGLISLVGGLRILFLQTNKLQLSADEMHYWDWSRQLDFAYYSKGPLMALLIRASTTVFGNSQLGVRLPAVILGAIFISLIYLHSRRRIGAWNALYLTGTVQLMPIVFGVGMAMTSDPPVLVFWTIALMAMGRAIDRDANPASSDQSGSPALAWVIYGLSTAIGITAKYTVALMPIILILASPWHPCTSKLLRHRWFWIGQAIALSGLLPMLGWNAAHNWVNFAHNLGHLGVTSNRPFDALQLIKGPAELAGSQLLMFGPLTLPILCLAAFKSVPKAWKEGNPFPLLLGWLGGALAVIFLLVSARRDVYANWPIPAGITAIFLTVEAWPQLAESTSLIRRISIASALNAALAILALLPFYGFRFGLTDSQLPTKKLVGWGELANTLRHKYGKYIASADIFLTDYYDSASALAYGLQLPPGRIFTLNLGSRRMTQYDVWAQKEMPKNLGANAIVVADESADPSNLRRVFEKVDRLPDLDIHVNGHPFRRYQVWFAHHYNGTQLPVPTGR